MPPDFMSIRDVGTSSQLSEHKSQTCALRAPSLKLDAFHSAKLVCDEALDI